MTSRPFTLLALVSLPFALGACGADPTGQMSPAPGVTAQQPSDGEEVTVQIAIPSGCDDFEKWLPLLIDGASAPQVGRCREEQDLGILTFSARMNGGGEVALSPGSHKASLVSVDDALSGGVVSLLYKDLGEERGESAVVSYSLI